MLSKPILIPKINQSIAFSTENKIIISHLAGFSQTETRQSRDVDAGLEKNRPKKH